MGRKKTMRMDFMFENRIPFIIEVRGNTIWLNASKAAENFGIDKSPGFWIRRRKTKEFFDLASEQMKCTYGKLVREERNEAGEREIWMNAFVAMEYLRWLPGGMADWFIGKVDGIIRDGTVNCQ